MKVKLQNVRLAFASIFAPKTVGGADGEARFSAAFPIEPGSKNAKALSDAIQSVASEKWGKKYEAVLAELEKKGRVCYREEPLSKDGEIYDGFEDMYSLNASNKARPTVVDRDRTPLTEKDGRPYSGCYVTAIVDVWAQDNSYGKRVNATLSGLQFVRDGEAFGGSAPAKSDDFDDLGDFEDDDDDDLA